jgi:hypothetical protein
MVMSGGRIRVVQHLFGRQALLRAGGRNTQQGDGCRQRGRAEQEPPARGRLFVLHLMISRAASAACCLRETGARMEMSARNDVTGRQKAWAA